MAVLRAKLARKLPLQMNRPLNELNSLIKFSPKHEVYANSLSYMYSRYVCAGVGVINKHRLINRLIHVC